VPPPQREGAQLTLGCSLQSDKAAPGHVEEVEEDPAEMGAPLPNPFGVEAGVPLAAERRRRDLVAEADSRLHKLTRLPKNLDCAARARAKLQDKLSKKGAFQRALTGWGDTITCDHLYSGAPSSRGLSGENDAFVVKDTWSGLIHAYPAPSKEAAYALSRVMRFRGRRRVNLVYSDNARELAHAARSVEAKHELSTLGIPKTSSMIERTSRVILAGATACLLEAGPPPCHWSFAAPCFCANHTCATRADEGPPCSLTRKAEFGGEIFPIGCLVTFLKSHARGEAGRWEPQGELGVFAGYRLQHGNKWNNEYLVWGLTPSEGRPVVEEKTSSVPEAAPPLPPPEAGIFLARGAGGRPESSGDVRVEPPFLAEEPPPWAKGKHEDIGSLPRVQHGLPGDGKVYRVDLEQRVKIHAAGRQYVANEHGRRPSTVKTHKPPGIASEEWRGIRRILKDQKAEEKALVASLPASHGV
jgi:hypothetical protein